ncbi:hypothetical protein [Mesorhizobium sp. M00.F.Ca.ET.217.01.1.1]|uniref:hypothetical protein n=1 Tax=Mesorhizobium sp. M00.F.Ca.ET.217.01.1.1 TaxID=2500529 RepID=UPI000FDAB12C|nr:hypothetical protein [Mesorhizobium sp. M00.F.Ca.ET.217.01.1.1]TGQ19328.1 hypothetical protein EN860_019565 [Mesorhizobium sp. M00.F.Ca.ET.217.01.1.1]
MALEVNGARGEVALRVGDVDLVIAATMAGLAAVSTRLECKSLGDLFQRLSGVEAAATMAAIELLTVRGDKAAALDALRLKHFKACSDAFALALVHHFDGEQKNEQAAPAAG